MTFVFLYTEIAEYFLACCNELAKENNVHIVRWPVNKEAPFEFTFNNKLKLYTKTDYSIPELHKLVETINPDVLVCSGWIDKDYLKISQAYFRKIPTVMTCDTHWTGSLKQIAATLISRFTLMRIFSHAWVPGNIQAKYAQKLGFKPGAILRGFYSCDLPYFDRIYQQQLPAKQQQFPKRFLYVGRYYEFKGIKDLWQAFIELQAETPCEWELWCLGTGDIEPIEHPKIRHFGFVQPKDLQQYTAQTGVFVLPSRFEPWGVVVQEFAASGFPLILSDCIGAGEQFLKEPENGFRFKAGNIAGMKQQMKAIINSPEQELLAMGACSNQLSKLNSPGKWAHTISSIKL